MGHVERIGWYYLGIDFIFPCCTPLHIFFLHSDYDSEHVRCTKECMNHAVEMTTRLEMALFTLKTIMLVSVTLHV